MSDADPTGEPAPLLTSSPLLGGPVGRRLRRRVRGPVAALAPVVLLVAVPLALAVLRQAACLSTGWGGRNPVWRQCASPLVADVAGHDLGRGLLAYLGGSVRLDEPVGSGVLPALLAGIAPGSGLGQQRWFLALWVVVAAAVLAGLVVAVGTVRGHAEADPVALALSPVVALTVLLSPALVPVALSAVAVWAWSRGRVVLAGVAVGLAVTGGLPALAVLLAMALLPGVGGRAATSRLLVVTSCTVAAAVVVVALLDVRTLTGPVQAWFRDGSGPGSLLHLPALAGFPVGAGWVALVGVLGLGAAAALVVLASRRPGATVGAVATVGVVAVLVTGPALPPAASLWVVPFAALAGLRWRDHLWWAGAEAVHAVALFTHLAAATDTGKGLPAGWYAIALSLRVAALCWVALRAWRATSWEHTPAAGTLYRLPS